MCIRDRDSGLEVSGVKTDQVGKLAYEAKIQILELTPKQASLEEVFLELTEGTEEFKAKESKDNK